MPHVTEHSATESGRLYHRFAILGRYIPRHFISYIFSRRREIASSWRYEASLSLFMASAANTDTANLRYYATWGQHSPRFGYRYCRVIGSRHCFKQISYMFSLCLIIKKSLCTSSHYSKRFIGQVHYDSTSVSNTHFENNLITYGHIFMVQVIFIAVGATCLSIIRRRYYIRDRRIR